MTKALGRSNVTGYLFCLQSPKVNFSVIIPCLHPDPSFTLENSRFAAANKDEDLSQIAAAVVAVVAASVCIPGKGIKREHRKVTC